MSEHARFHKPRANTIDLTQLNAKAVIRPDEPYFKYTVLSPQVDENIKSVLEKNFRIKDEVYNKKYKDEIKSVMINSVRAGEKFDVKSCPPKMKNLINAIQEAYEECKAWKGLQRYPPQILHVSEKAKMLTFIVIDLIRSVDPKAASIWVKWFARHIVPDNLRTLDGFKSKYVKCCCVCHRKRKMFKDNNIFWAILDRNNIFTLYDMTSGTPTIHMEAHIARIELSRSGKTVKLFNQAGSRVKRIIPLDPEQNELWAKAMKPMELKSLPFFFTSSKGPVPDQLLLALNEAILQPDGIILTTLTDFNVSKVSSNEELAAALLDIFSYAGKVNNLLTTLSANEFADPALKPNTVVRGNSHLTNLFKVFFHRFGKKYYDEFLRRVVLYIDSKGDLHIKTPPEADAQKAKVMVSTVLKRIARSFEHVPDEIKHFACILKQAASIRFNLKEATYNVISGFFFLRFVSSILSNPKEMDPEINLKCDWIQVMVPTAQLLTMPFNLLKLSGRYDVFNSWDDDLEKNVFPQLVMFAMSLGVCDKAPTYAPPTKERLREALQIVWKQIELSGNAFVKKLKETIESSTYITPLEANIANFLTGYFSQNI